MNSSSLRRGSRAYSDNSGMSFTSQPFFIVLRGDGCHAHHTCLVQYCLVWHDEVRHKYCTAVRLKHLLLNGLLEGVAAISNKYSIREQNGIHPASATDSRNR